MNLKKTLATLILLSCFLAAFFTLPSENVDAQSLPVYSGRHASQAGISQSFGPAAPVKPLPDLSSSAGCPVPPE